MNKKILYIDMDDTIADFCLSANNQFGRVESSRMYKEGFFFNLKPIPGSLSSVRKLIEMGFDVWILTQPLSDSFLSYTEKAQWIGQWFPELKDKIVMTQNKGLHIGNYLIDDNKLKWKTSFESGGGKFVHFDYHKALDKEAEWTRIIKYFENEDPTLSLKGTSHDFS